MTEGWLKNVIYKEVSMNKKVYIFLADGFEDIEGLTVVDLMRREIGRASCRERV